MILRTDKHVSFSLLYIKTNSLPTCCKIRIVEKIGGCYDTGT